MNIKEMEDYAKVNDIPIMQKEGIEFIRDFIQKNNVKTILEIGSAIGYSAIMMANMRDDITVYTIELDEERYKIASENIRENHLEKRIIIKNEDALYANVQGCFDLIFIDAAKAQYIKFFERYSPLLHENGAIITDNLKFHGFVEHMERIKSRNLRQLVTKIKKYITYLKENKEFETEFLDIGDGVAITRYKKQK